jgi:hypothetical protein
MEDESTMQDWEQLKRELEGLIWLIMVQITEFLVVMDLHQDQLSRKSRAHLKKILVIGTTGKMLTI